MRPGAQAETLWARADLRRRWVALVALGVIAGLTAGFAMAAVAGARRSATALDRFRAETHAADAVVFASQVGIPHPDWTALRARPEVADLAVWNLLFGNVDGAPEVLFAAQDDGFLNRSNTPIVVAGRMWDPSAPDEVVVTQDLVKEAPIGTTVEFQGFGSDQSDADETPTGPTQTLRVVGVVKTINEFLFTPGQVFVSPGYVAQYSDRVRFAENVDVRLRNGAADIPALQRDVSEVVAPGTPVLDLHAVSRRVDTTISVERAALLLLAVAIAVAGGLLVAQAIARSAGVIEDDARVLRAVGMTRRRIAGTATLPHVLSAAVAVVVAVVTAIAASRAFPVGLSRKLDPDVGVHVDWVVVLVGALATASLVLLDAFLVAQRVSRPAIGTARRPSGIVAALRGRTPTAVGIGTSMALESGVGRSRVAVRPALIGAIVGVVGVVATLTINYAVNDALAHPERAGVTWDALVDPLPDSYEAHGLDADLVDEVEAAAPAGSAVATIGRLVVPVGGVGVQTFALEQNQRPGARAIELAVVEGRGPAADGEVALGPKTAHDLHVGIGDTVAFGEEATPLRIVGSALFPPDVHAEFDEGVWVTKSQLEAVVPDVDREDFFEGPSRAVVVRFAAGVNATQATQALGGALTGHVISVDPAEVPVELTNLRNIRALPVALAAFLALLAVAAVSHVLLTSASRRRRDFAVLRALGFNRRGTRVVLNAQGTAIALVGVVVGVPLGVAIGRTAWRWVADQVPLTEVPPLALVATLVVTPIAVIVVNLLALWPGRRVSRLQPAEVLRAE